MFHLDSEETRLDESDPDLPIWIVGGPRARELATSALRRFLETLGYPHRDESDNPAYKLLLCA